MAHTTHYEIHVKQKGRWEIHARYSASEKEASIEEAKNLDTLKHIDSVKVIQEIYNPDDGTSKEYNVYAPGQKKRHPAGRAPSAKKTPDQEAGRSASSRKKEKPRDSFSGLILKILAITVFGSVIGGLFTWFVSMVIVETTISNSAQFNILIFTFLLTFVMAAVPMAIVFLNTKKK